MSLRHYFFSALIALSLVSGGLGAARAEDAPSTHEVREQFAHSFANTVLSMLQDQKKSYGDRKVLLRDAFAKSVDIDWIAKFVLGRNWASATPEERDNYVSLYRKYLAETYVSHFADDPSKRISDIKIDGVNDAANDSDFTVKTEMKLADFETMNVNYLVRENNGRYKVIDISIENVSLIETHRTQFASIAATSGVEGVIAKLKMMNEGDITLTMK